ncbi:ABC transporter permease [Paenibacillus contaminans]|uniref:ABC transporter permease n=1 Tax=Paenibacillus contaminans TaxID=450362 RepID=A0A329LUG0_9BACL|nr:ABC transporter permease [Paenibacillus contaminans]RAV10790.1 ABC transporter permease [Paenibacillus contaminans]
MTFSTKRFTAILSKEWKDAMKNPQILLLAAMPVMFAFLYSKMDGGIEALIFPILLALSMTGAFVQANMISEEKEKHTLRVLMLSPASTSEVLLGKSALTTLLTFIVVAGCVFISDIQLAGLGFIAIMLLLSLVMFIAIGTIIGLVSRTVSETSITGLPVLLIFVMAPAFAPMLKQPLVSSAVRFLPTQHFMDAVIKLSQGVSVASMYSHLVNIVIWAALSLVVCYIVYGKKRFDK